MSCQMLVRVVYLYEPLLQDADWLTEGHYFNEAHSRVVACYGSAMYPG